MEFWRFATPPPEAGPPLEGSYDPYLVLLSIVVACVAGLTALMIIDRMNAARTAAGRWGWHTAGAFAMGSGIWAMHFTGMLAFSAPLDAAYDARITAVSVIPALLGSGAALYFIAQSRMGGTKLHVGALLMALGIGTMHYTGMEAMELAGLLRYDPFYFVLSLVVAHVLALIAIYVRFFLRGLKALSEGGLNAVAGTIMGLAVVGMHYTAMASARIYELPGTELRGWMVPETSLAVTIAGLAGGIMAVGILATRVEKGAIQGVLEELAYHDPLTGLANRLLLEKQLEEALATCDRLGTALAVVFLDLNDFKAINDSFGHETGDQVLQGVAARLEATTRPMDTVARFGGDEFVLVAKGLTTQEDAGSVAANLLSALEDPIRIGDWQWSARASIGISVYPGDGDSPDALIQQADTAMYQAKADGDAYRFFDRELADRAYERVWLGGELRQALKRQELVFHYQPWVDLETGQWQGMEALARWFHPEQGEIAPGRFIPVAERTGMTADLGEYAFREVCRQTREWLDAGLLVGRIAINVSAKELHHPELVARIRELLAEREVPGSCLELEITESSLISKELDILARLQEIRGLGLTLSVDDFGTGYSSLSYLKSLPVDKLKIDQSFVRNDDPRDHAIIRAVAEMGARLGFLVVAEGIETPGQRQTLLELGCPLGQGFLFARPGPVEGLERDLAQSPA